MNALCLQTGKILRVRDGFTDLDGSRFVPAKNVGVVSVKTVANRANIA
jgi:hypothetical protein